MAVEAYWDRKNHTIMALKYTKGLTVRMRLSPMESLELENDLALARADAAANP